MIFTATNQEEFEMFLYSSINPYLSTDHMTLNEADAYYDSYYKGFSKFQTILENTPCTLCDKDGINKDGEDCKCVLEDEKEVTFNGITYFVGDTFEA